MPLSENTVTISPTITPAPTATPVAPYVTTVTLTPPVVRAGDVLVVTGSGFSPGERLLLSFSDRFTGYGLADAAGRLDGYAFRVPAGAAPGTYSIRLIGMSSGRTATGAALVVLRAAPAVVLDVSPPSCTPGSTFVASGSGFMPRETLTVALDGVVVSTAIADMSGSFETAAVRAPAGLQPGLHEVSATGSVSGNTAAAVLTIVGLPAHVALNPGSLEVGGHTTLAGAGFAARERVVITVDRMPVAGVTSDEAGRFSMSIRADFGVGRHRVTATGSHSRRSAVATLLLTAVVNPALSVHPASARRGGRIAVSGTHFAAKEIVIVRFDGAFVQAATVDSSGRFAALTFQVPRSAPLGWNSITALGSRSARVGGVRIYIMRALAVPATGGAGSRTPAIVARTPTARSTPTLTATPTMRPTATVTATRRPTATATDNAPADRHGDGNAPTDRHGDGNAPADRHGDGNAPADRHGDQNRCPGRMRIHLLRAARPRSACRHARSVRECRASGRGLYQRTCLRCYFRAESAAGYRPHHPAPVFRPAYRRRTLDDGDRRSYSSFVCGQRGRQYNRCVR